MITLAREFISPDQSFACADDVLAEAADHSSEVDTAHYAVIHGALPRITNNEMNRHRWLAEEWASLLGLGPFPPPEPVALVRRKARSAKPLEAKELAAQVPGLVADAVMNSLAAIGLTRDTVQMLSDVVERQLDSSLDIQDRCELPPPGPSPPHPRQSMITGELYTDPIEDPDRPFLRNPLGSGDSEARGTSPGHPSAQSRRESTPGMPNSPSPAGALESRSSYQHPFEIIPGMRERSTQATTFQIGPSSRRRSAAEISIQTEQSLRPSKRRRLHQIDAQLRREETSEEDELPLGGDDNDNSADEVQLTLDGDSDDHSADEVQLTVEEDHDDNSMDDLPLCEVTTLTGTQTLRSSRGEEDRMMVKNVMNPRMFGESVLQGNIRHAMRELVHNRDAREKSLAQMLAIMLVMRRNQDAMITIRTGGGKSMLWMVPPLLDPKVKLLVVCPFKVLLEEQLSKAKKANICALAFSSGTVVPTNTQILFVQVEHVGSKTLTQ